MRSRTLGRRSVITTTTDLLVARSITRTLVPNGRLRCAAVGKVRLNDEPLATRRSFYLASRKDDFAEPAADLSPINSTDIPYVMAVSNFVLSSYQAASLER